MSRHGGVYKRTKKMNEYLLFFYCVLAFWQMRLLLSHLTLLVEMSSVFFCFIVFI